MNRALSILIVGAFPWPTWQGSQAYVTGQAQALARRGHDVVVACWAASTRPAPREVDVVRAARFPGAVTHSGPHWTRLPQDVSLARTVARVLRRRRVDVIHAHNVEAPIAAWTAMRATGMRVPLVYDLHTSMAEELPAFLGKASAPLGAAVDHLVPRLADLCIAISDRAEAHLLAHGARRVARVSPGVDVSELAGGDAGRARAKWGLRGPVVVYVGNADRYQDLDLLRAAMHRVPDATLLLVTSDAVPQADGVRVVRPEGFADVLDALAASDVAALPRVACTGFPIKLLNYLGVGLPTVASHGSAQPYPGVVPVDPEPGAMAAAIRALLADEGRRRELGDQARAYVAAELSRDRSAAALEAAYALVTPSGARS